MHEMPELRTPELRTPELRTMEHAIASHPPSFDVERVRQDFPILAREVHGKPLVYLDTAASAQRQGPAAAR